MQHNGWTLVDRRYGERRYPSYDALEQVDAALQELADRRDTVRYWHVTGRVDVDDGDVVAALDTFAALDRLDRRDTGDPRTIAVYELSSGIERMEGLREAYGYAETPYLLPALDPTD